MVTNLNSLITYLEGYKDNISTLKHVEIVFTWHEILELQLQRVQYPALVVEVLEVALSDVGGTATEFEVACSIIKSVPNDNKNSEKWTAMNEMLELGKEVREKVFCDSEDNEEGFDAGLETIFDPITSATLGNCYGWRFMGKIKIYG